MVYVDDFKLAGPAQKLPEAWAQIMRHIHMDKPTPIGRYLGCDHRRVLRTAPGTKVRAWVMEYDMSSFMSQCLEVYARELCEDTSKLRDAPTPFPAVPPKYVRQVGG